MAIRKYYKSACPILDRESKGDDASSAMRRELTEDNSHYPGDWRSQFHQNANDSLCIADYDKRWVFTERTSDFVVDEELKTSLPLSISSNLASCS